MLRRPTRRAAAPLLSLLLLLAGCGGSDGSDDGGPPTGPEPPDEPDVASISVTPERAAVQQDSVLSFEATARDAQGDPISDVTFSWSVEDPSVASVDDQGRAEGLEPGETTVIAAAEGEEGSSPLKVRSGRTVVVDSTRLELVSDSAERAGGTLRFRVVGEDPPQIESGDFVVGAEDGGFLRRATSVSGAGDELVVETEFAALDEAVDSASFQGAVTVGTGGQSGSVRGDRVHWGPTYSRYSAAGVTLQDGALIIDDLTLLQGEVCGDSGSACVDAEVVVTSGKVRFSPEVDVSARIEYFELREFRAVGGADLEFDLAAEARATGQLQDSGEQVIHQVGKPFVFQAGPVPVAGEVRVTFSIGYEAEARADYEVGAGFESAYGTRIGAEYADGSWSRVFEVEKSFDPRPLTTELAGEARARAFVKPELSVVFYSVVGPSAFAEPYLQGEAVFREACTFDLTAGMDAGVGFAVEILGKDLASFERTMNIATTSLLSRNLGCPGDLAVTTSTEGPDPDTDGYTIDVDGERAALLAADDSTLLEDLPGGDHEVAMGDVQSNCQVDGANPRSVTVEDDRTALAAFSVSCDPRFGQLRIVSATTGDQPDPDGYELRVDAQPVPSLSASGEDSVTVPDLPPEDYEVLMLDVESNCEIQGANPKTATVEPDATARVVFEVDCPTPTGDLRVTTSTGGEFQDPDGYDVLVDGDVEGHVDPDGSITFSDVEAGDHAVGLGDVSSDCEVEGDNPRTVTIRADRRTTADFTISCGVFGAAAGLRPPEVHRLETGR